MLFEDKDFTLYSSEHEYVIEFYYEPKIKQESLMCSNGVEILPNSLVKKLHGHKTSAGFGRIDCEDGWFFKYLGKIDVCLHDTTEQKRTFVLFDVIHNGEKVNKPEQFNLGTKHYYPCYSFVERVYDEKKKKYENCLFYANASYGSGRVIETDIVEISLEQRHSA